MSPSPQSSTPSSPSPGAESPPDRDALQFVRVASAVLVPLYVAAEFLALLDYYPWIELGGLTLEWTTLVALAFAVVVLADAARVLRRDGLAVRPVAEGSLALLTGYVAVSGLVQLNTGRAGVYFAGMFAAILATALAVVVLVGWVLDRARGSSPGPFYAANR